MASKRRNMFRKNKMQETTENEDGSVRELNVVWKNSTSVHLSWKSTRTSFTVLYSCEEILATGDDCRWDSQKFVDVKTNGIIVSSLFPFREYKFKVCSELDCSDITVTTSES
ncbi:hypothetical protein AAG570_009580 [Ranatra chinensis]|uniref:Fibronectin type-III domain-containing protein n=1 Tax=Ranatra chinensis TaxID=642074 RepID=A0ABD0YRN0_9HEMI